MSEIRIESVADRIAVSAPFNAGFNAAAKARSGRWDSERRAWIFHVEDVDFVKSLCLEYHGSDGSAPAETCTLRVFFPKDDYAERGSIRLNGRDLASASGRDSGAKLGHDVVLESGKVGSGGSHQYWRTTVKAGTVLLVRSFPKAKAVELAAEDPSLYSVVLPPSAPALDRAALEAERVRLAARMEEIDRLLA